LVRSRWRRWAACGSALFILGGQPVAAAISGRTAFDLPLLTDPGYAYVRSLERAGFETGFPIGTFNSRKRLTRYEFATAVLRLYRSVCDRAAVALAPGQLTEHLDSCRFLLHRFEEDVRELGADTDEFDRNLDALSRRIEALIPARKSANTAIAAAQRGGVVGRSTVQPAVRLPSQIVTPGGYFEPSPALMGLTPGLAAGIGPFSVDVKARPGDSLGRFAAAPAFIRGSEGLDARLNVALGHYLFSAYYQRQDGAYDPYRILNPYSSMGIGPAQGVGGSVRGALGNRLNFQLETGSLSPLTVDPYRKLFVRADLHYRLAGLILQLGVERSLELGMPGSALDATAYSMGFGRDLGRNTRVNLLYRFYGGRSVGPDGNTLRSFSDTGAIGQLSVRF
jgi:hypothetical protein